MRPEILKLQAFGPYVKQQCINFHVFDEQHLVSHTGGDRKRKDDAAGCDDLCAVWEKQRFSTGGSV